MKESFNTALMFTLSFEGGYVNDPHDPGGETKFGISKNSYPNESIADLTIERATELYKRDYWDKMLLDESPSPLDIAIFDTAVNIGVARTNGLILRGTSWSQLLVQRIIHYVDIARRKPEMQRYLSGWLRRTIELAALCGRET